MNGGGALEEPRPLTAHRVSMLLGAGVPWIPRGIAAWDGHPGLPPGIAAWEGNLGLQWRGNRGQSGMPSAYCHALLTFQGCTHTVQLAHHAQAVVSCELKL